MKLRTLAFAALAVIAASIGLVVVQARPADATPSKQRDCSACHGNGSYQATVTATPSAPTVAAGATYTVAITISENPNGPFNTGYWVANSTAAGATGTSTGVYAGGSSGSQSYTATMTAPATPGTYYYKVFGVDGLDDNSGIVGYAVYSVNVVTPVHDVSTYLGYYPRVRHVSVGYVGGFYAVYSNTGNMSETFTATLSATNPSSGSSTLDSRSVTLAAGARTTVYYPGVLTYSAAGPWTITATAGPVTGETATGDNSYVRARTVTGGTTLVIPRGARLGG